MSYYNPNTVYYGALAKSEKLLSKLQYENAATICHLIAWHHMGQVNFEFLQDK